MRAKWAAEVRAARKKKLSGDEIYKLEDQWNWEVGTVEEELDQLKTDQLRQLARKHDVPLPPRPSNRDEESDYWDNGHNYRQWSLTRAGRVLVRDAIDKEEKRRRDRITWWIPIISSLTGLFGVIVAILALFHKW